MSVMPVQDSNDVPHAGQLAACHVPAQDVEHQNVEAPMEGVNEGSIYGEDHQNHDAVADDMGSGDTPGMKIKLVLRMDDEELRLGVLQQGDGDGPEVIGKESVEEDLSLLRVHLADLLGLQYHGKVADQNR